MFRIKASYADQLELRTTIERAREFFGELRNFADLMPGIEGIRKEAGGIMRWVVRAEVPIIGAVHASFTVETTAESAERLPRARELHRFAILVGESAISAEMQKRVREMIKTFLERARVKLEGEEQIDQSEM